MHGSLISNSQIRGGNQDPAEFAQFLDLVRTLDVKSYLEIGCRNGDTFDAVMRTIGEGGYGLGVDLSENWRTKRNLKSTLDNLHSAGISADVIFGNSQNVGVIEKVRAAGPFDLILIDADHRYDGIRRDFSVYADMGRVVVLHDVSAPAGHMSDGYPNGVGVFWNEIKDGFRHQEFITLGSLMGFGILYREASDVAKPVASPTVPPLFIACPAWGKYYVDLACRFTIPAVIASLTESPFEDVTFLIHTDDQETFRKAIGDYKIKFMPLLARSPIGEKPARLPDDHWVAFKRAHKDALEATPPGGIAVLLNSDIVVSRECFAVVAKAFNDPKIKTVVSVGIRTAIDHAEPPIGVSAEELARWIWKNQHHITRECNWKHGRSQHPTILFFEDEQGVTMRGFHLTPMFVRRSRDAVKFKGTIDDDLLMNFRDHEIKFLKDGEVIFAELSPDWKTHPFGNPLSVQHVVDFWKRRGTMRPHYVRNFKQSMRVLGNPMQSHPAVDQIIAGLSR
jgi:SAM-dependent methyltransferase